MTSAEARKVLEQICAEANDLGPATEDGGRRVRCFYILADEFEEFGLVRRDEDGRIHETGRTTG